MDVKQIISFFKHLHITGTHVQIGTLDKVIAYGEQIFPDSSTFVKLLQDYENHDMYFLGNIAREKYKPAPHKRETHDDDIEQKRYVFFDFDVRNYFKENDMEISDEEIKDIANDFAIAAKDHPLWGKWSYIVFTGNGIHVYYTSLASYVNKKQFSLGYKHFAEEIDVLFGVPSDKKCSNTARIARLPGSRNNKGGKHTLVEIIASQPQESFVIDQIMSYQPQKKVESVSIKESTIVFPEYVDGVSYDEVLAFVKKNPIREMCSDFGIEVTYKGEVILNGEVTSARINDEGNYINRFSGKGGSGDFISLLKEARNIDFKSACDLVANMYFKKQVVFSAVNNKQIASEEMKVAALTRAEQIREEASKITDILGRFKMPQTKNVKTWGISNVDEKFGNVRNGEYILFLGEAGTGKCLGKGTNVMMADCSIKKVEDIVVGDKVMGPDSKPRNVLRLGRGREQMYKIIPNRSKEDFFICNGSHILSLRVSGSSETVNISVDEYMKLKDGGRKGKKNLKLYRSSLDFSEKEQTLEPYFLGIWLADGDSTSPTITNKDEEVITYIKEYANRLGHDYIEYIHEGRCRRHAIRRKRGKMGHYNWNIERELSNIGVLGDKHIPSNFLLASEEQRLQLLAGIIDGDGHKDNNNCYEITLKQYNLCKQVQFLARSLGFSCSLKKKICHIKSIGFSGEYYRMHISGDMTRLPLKIVYKRSQKNASEKHVVNKTYTGFKIEPQGVGDYYGFELDGDHLYLLDSFIVTHNTTFCLNMMIENAKRGVKCLFLSLEMAKDRIEDRYIETRAQITQQDRERGKYTESQMNIIEESVRELQNPYIHMVDMRLLKDDKRNWILMKELFNSYDIIFIDNFSKIIPRDNKEEYQLQSMISEEIANYVEDTGKVIVMLHHYGKQMGASKARGMEARGSQKLIDDISTHFSLQRADDGSNATIISVKKGRYIPVGSVAVLYDHGKYKPYMFDEIGEEPQKKKYTDSVIF